MEGVQSTAAEGRREEEGINWQLYYYPGELFNSSYRSIDIKKRRRGCIALLRAHVLILTDGCAEQAGPERQLSENVQRMNAQ
jgi:hypothetical protein